MATQNQAPDPSPAELRRASNERIAQAAVAHRFDRVTAVPFICECSRGECSELLRLTLDEMAAARTRARYLVAPGHPGSGGAVHTERGYWVVD